MEHKNSILECLVEGQRLDQGIKLAVKGDSMAPLLRHGDSVLVNPCSSHDCQPGDLVVFRAGGALLTHRLVRKTLTHLISKGDANLIADPPHSLDDFVGLVQMIRRGKMSYDLRFKGARWLTKPIACISGFESGLYIPRFAGKWSTRPTRWRRFFFLPVRAAVFGLSTVESWLAIKHKIEAE